MKNFLMAIALCLMCAVNFVSCDYEEPKIEENLSYEDSLILSYKTRLIGDTSLIWWTGGITPNITTFASLYKFKKDSVLYIQCGWLGYDGNDDNHFSIREIKKYTYDIKIDNTGWNVYLKIGNKVGLFTMPEDENSIVFRYDNVKYVGASSKSFEDIDNEVNKFMSN